jgi:membrane-bound lytic murein transglycosylase MltF
LPSPNGWDAEIKMDILSKLKTGCFEFNINDYLSFGGKILILFLSLIVCPVNFAIAASQDDNPILILTEAEAEYVNSLQNKGKITVAMRRQSKIYEPQENGIINGFVYKLVKHLSELLKVSLEIKTVKFGQYFQKNGTFPSRIKTDPDFTYTPDLINKVDFYADNITIIPWRKKILTFVETVPVRQMLMTRKGEEIRKIEQLIGKKIASDPLSSFAVTFNRLEKKLSSNLNRPVVFDYFETRLLDMVKAVVDGRADVTIRDSNVSILTTDKYPELSISMAVSDKQMLGWAIKKNNKEMAGILKKFINYSHKTGLFDKFWQEEYNISYIEYIKQLE